MRAMRRDRPAGAKTARARRATKPPVPGAVILGRLSWAKLDATDADIERDVKFILGEQDFSCLCQGQGPGREDRPAKSDAPDGHAGPFNAHSNYYRGRDAAGNSVTIRVVWDSKTMQ